jgi:hypothetical protein
VNGGVLVGYALIAGIGFLTYSTVASLFTGRTRFTVGPSFGWNANRADSPSKFWLFVAGNAAVAIVAVAGLGPIAFRMAGL